MNLFDGPTIMILVLPVCCSYCYSSNFFDNSMYIFLVTNSIKMNQKSRSGPGPNRVRPQGSVHSAPGPGPTKLGPVHLSLARTLRPMGSVRSGPRSARSRTEPRTIYFCPFLSLHHPFLSCCLPFCSSFCASTCCVPPSIQCLFPAIYLNRPVSAMNLKNARKVLGFDNTSFMSMFLPPQLLCSSCLALLCAGQCRIRCCTDSFSCWHAGQMGESHIPIRFKCLASGAWPVRNCVRMLACLLGSLAISLMYMFDGEVGSVPFIFANRGDLFHIFCARNLILLLKEHIWVDLLLGSGFLRYSGRCCTSLLFSVIAFFAWASACSFPSTSLCPGIHLNLICIPWFLFLSASIDSWSLSKMWCPGAGLASCVAMIAARLST